eukprot:504-Prymnesium_polylepis.1
MDTRGICVVICRTSRSSLRKSACEPPVEMAAFLKFAPCSAAGRGGVSSSRCCAGGAEGGGGGERKGGALSCWPPVGVAGGWTRREATVGAATVRGQRGGNRADCAARAANSACAAA